MKRLILFAIILWGCSKQKATYNLKTLSSDISSFSHSEQAALMDFSVQYEGAKSLKDSIKGVPVALVPSLTYSGILEHIKKNQQKARNLDSLKYNKIVELIEQKDIALLNGLSIQHWIITENFLEQTGIKLAQGRNFSSEFNEENAVIINEELASELKLEVGDQIDFEGPKYIIGVLSKVQLDYQIETHFILATLKK